MPEQFTGSVVDHEVTMECVDASDRLGHVEATFRYDRNDPVAVTVTFRVAGQEPVPWTFARSLLTHGTTQPIGLGDVHIRPGLGRDGRAMTVLRLSSPEGSFSAQARTSEVNAFLTRSFGLVADGSEVVDVDLLVADLLA